MDNLVTRTCVCFLCKPFDINDRTQAFIQFTSSSSNAPSNIKTRAWLLAQLVERKLMIRASHVMAGCDFIKCMAYALCLVFIYKIIDSLVRLPRIANISDKCVLITGCDTGFGHSIAKRLDTLGFHVYAGCFTKIGQVRLRKFTSDKSVKILTSSPRVALLTTCAPFSCIFYLLFKHLYYT